MTRWTVLEAALVLLILAATTLGFLSAPDTQQRNYVFTPEMLGGYSMLDGPAYRPQDPLPSALGRTHPLQPPEGTIARTHLPLDGGAVLLNGTEVWKTLAQEQKDAWDGLGPDWNWATLDARGKTPILERGAHVFQTFCIVCHGPSGKGDGIITKRGGPPPKSFLEKDIQQMTDGHMFRSITHGSVNMASYASQVGREDRWKVIRYIRSLQQAP
jgi:mono/diheme cytochrome c family protein